LPTVRALAAAAGVSAATVAAAYSRLRVRGLIVTAGRRGTRVAARPPLSTPAAAPARAGLRDLSSGNPDPKLLPRFPRLRPRQVLYGEDAKSAALVELARAGFAADGIETPALAIVGGALDGLERVLQAHLRTGDRVAVEDPGFTRLFDLLGALGLVPEPVQIDERGAVPEAVERALARGAAALVLTPRAQNPTGSAFDASRAEELRRLLAAHPHVLVVEDDHAGPVAGVPALSVCGGELERWAVVRSFSKALGPDLRLAALTGDTTTVARVEGRQLLGTGWVSHLLQQTAALMLSDLQTTQHLAQAAVAYEQRRAALLAALAARGIEARGRSGFNVWVPVDEETRVVQALADAGWAVAAGERFRLASAPGVRVTVAGLQPSEAARLADDLAAVLRPSARTHAA
jgi:DNA-binding transcriptional MocR family regulator